MGVQVPPFKHGFGMQGVMMRSQVGALPLQVPLGRQVRIAVPLSV
jgi:hypothetical protein